MNIVFKKILGDPQAKTVKRLRKRAKLVNNLADKYQKMSDKELRSQTEVLKQRLKKQSLDDIMPDAFAVVREAATRTLGQRHFDVQLIGGLVLHEGNVAEMKTGEGKTLVATLAVYLNALTEKGVHVVTVNDYLAQRDAGWMGQVYGFLGLKAGVIIADHSYIYDEDFTNTEHDAGLYEARRGQADDVDDRPTRAEAERDMADEPEDDLDWNVATSLGEQ